MLFVTTQLGTPIYVAKDIQVMALRADAEKQTATLGIQYGDGTQELVKFKEGDIITSKMLVERLGEHKIKLDEVVSSRKLNLGLDFPIDVPINRWQNHWGLAANQQKVG